MALITSAASGNFNAGATWTGGVVPTTGDEARASTGHTVTINVNTTCDEISNAGTGKFVINDGVTLTANVTNKSTTIGATCLEFSTASPASASIVGNLTGGTAVRSHSVKNTTTGTLNVTGNINGGTTSGGSTTVHGAIENVSTGIINITGNCFGGTVLNFCGAYNNTTGTLNVTGNSEAGTGSGANGAHNFSTGTLSIIGTVTASQTAAGVAGANVLQQTILSGPFITETTRGVNPVYCAAWRWNASPSNSTYLEVMTNNLLAKRNLVTADNVTGMPAATNVKSGVVYGPFSELTGTFSQTVTPSISDISKGVWDYALSAITTSSTIGTLLKTNIDATISSRSTATTAGIADAVWDEATSDHTASGTYGGRVVRATNANNELQINAQNHAAANVHQFQTAVITASAFDASVLTAFAVPELQEIHAIHGLKSGSALTVTPSSRSAGAISQSITGDGTTTTTVTRT